MGSPSGWIVFCQKPKANVFLRQSLYTVQAVVTPACVLYRLAPERVFEALPPGVLDELKARLPKNEHGNRRAKLWQLLTVDTGIPHLDRQLTADLTLMQISEHKQQFEEHWDKLFGRQPKLPLYMPKELEA